MRYMVYEVINRPKQYFAVYDSVTKLCFGLFLHRQDAERAASDADKGKDWVRRCPEISAPEYIAVDANLVRYREVFGES